MDIDTSTLDAARRNLIAFSVGFIVFSLGDAHFLTVDGKVAFRTFFGAIGFNNPDVLVIAAWVMLGWFLFRFWQFSEFKHYWHIYSATMSRTYLFKKFIAVHGQKPRSIDVERSITAQIQTQPLFGNWKWPVNDGQFIVDRHDYYRKSILILWVAITTPYFGQFYLPFVLAIVAIGLGVSEVLCV